MPTIKAATRGSVLARWQTEHVAGLLNASDASISVDHLVVSTEGDRRTDVPIHEIGGKGVFAKEVQNAVLDGRADIAVHSGKDLPSVAVPGLVIAAIPERADARDALIGCSLEQLPEFAIVATGSVRRRAQLLYLRPDLIMADIRGNVDTRLGRLDDTDDFDAIVMASAPIDRLGLQRDDVFALPVDVMLPQVAQGALIVECRADDVQTLAALAAIDNDASRRVVEAERAFLTELGGDCDLPAGAHATLESNGMITITGMLATEDAEIVCYHLERGDDPVAVGTRLAQHIRSDFESSQ